MVAYIIEIARDIALLSGHNDTQKWRAILHRTSALVDEMKQLDARDFLPAHQCQFVEARSDLAAWVEQWQRDPYAFLNSYINGTPGQCEVRNRMDQIIAVLKKYGGEGWRAQTRSFSFIKDNDLKEIIERDYKELTLVLFPGGAWKSTVIMAGSILEAILFDLLGSDPATQAKAMASPAAPTQKGTVRPMEDWTLESLIKVAADLGILPPNRADTFDQVLRDYRNFVHPKKEIKSAHPCGEGEAQLAMGGLNAVCDILQP